MREKGVPKRPDSIAICAHRHEIEVEDCGIVVASPTVDRRMRSTVQFVLWQKTSTSTCEVVTLHELLVTPSVLKDVKRSSMGVGSYASTPIGAKCKGRWPIPIISDLPLDYVPFEYGRFAMYLYVGAQQHDLHEPKSGVATATGQ